MSRLEKFIVRDDRPAERRWLDRVKDSVRAYWQGPIQSSDAALDRFLSDAPPAASGVFVSDATALGVSAFYCAVATISQDVASLPLFLFKSLSGGGSVRYTDHPLNYLLHDRPSPEMTAFNFRAALMMNVLTCGKSYAEIVRDPLGRPGALWHIEPGRVSPIREGGVLTYRVRGSGTDAILEAANMLHFKGPSPDGVVGFDVVMLAREALGLAIASERFGARFFSNGSQLGGILSEGSGLTEPARENLRKALKARHEGSDNAHRWLLAPTGTTFQEVGVHPRDSQLNELRVHQVREIARFFRIPVSYLGDLERATFSNFEQQQLQYFTNCIRPWLVNIEQELNAKLIAPSEKNLQHCEHVTAGFLRADVAQRGQFYALMSQNGLMAPNEIRALENLPPIAGGDVARVPLNTAPMGVSSRSAHRDLLIDVLDRLRATDVNKVSRMSTPDQLRAHAERSIGDHIHRSNVVFHIRSAVRAALSSLERESDTEAVCDTLARQYGNSLRTDILAFADRAANGVDFSMKLGNQVSTWKTSSRSAQLVDDTMFTEKTR